MLENKNSNGPAAYIFDLLDPMFLGQFTEECDKIFEAFEKLAPPPEQVDQLPAPPNDK